MFKFLLLSFLTVFVSAISPVAADQEQIRLDCQGTAPCDVTLQSAQSVDDIQTFKGKRPRPVAGKGGKASGRKKALPPGKKAAKKPPKKTKHASKSKSSKKLYKNANYKGVSKSPGAMKHIRKTHMNRSKAGKKSQWRDKNFMNAAIKSANGKPYSIAAKNGYHVRTFDMGKRVGKTQSGRPTSHATVVTNKHGHLVTAYPGHP